MRDLHDLHDNFQKKNHTSNMFCRRSLLPTTNMCTSKVYLSKALYQKYFYSIAPQITITIVNKNS